MSFLAKTLSVPCTLYSLFLILIAFTSITLSAQVSVPTWRYDNSHAGQNTNETILTPSNVSTSTFGLLFTHAVDGNMYAQPLYMPNLTMSDGNQHNVVFAATENDKVYAFDADSNGGANANAIWTANLASTAHGAASGATYIKVDSSKFLSDILPNVGITGTPVIDPTTNTMYVVAATSENGGYVVRLHALNILNGNEKANSPVAITATVAGTGTGSSGGQLAFDPFYNNQRPALDLYNGYVYIGFGSHGDEGDYHGWLFSYNATTLAQNDVICLAPNGTSGGTGNGGGAGIWSSGSGLPIDAVNAGRLFLVTGNGYYNGTTDWGESILNFDLTGGKLNLTDSFTAYNQASLSQSDLDLGSGGLLMPPDQQGAHQHMLIQVGKDGHVLVLDRDNLTGYHPGGSSNTHILQDIPGQTGGLWSTPAYWNGKVYFWGAQKHPTMFNLNSGVLDTTPDSTGTPTSNNPGASFSISSNGTQDGIAWAVRSDGYTSHGPEILYAFNANDLTDILYESDTNSARDNPGDAMKFAVPVVANGKVYVISDGNYAGQLDVYGLLNGQPTTATPVISPNGGTFQVPNNVSVTITSATNTASIYYTLDGSTPTTASTAYTGAFTVSTDTVVKAIASAPNYLQSLVASADFDFTGQTPVPTFTPAAGTYAGTQAVTIADTDSEASIYYTIDGSTPTASSTKYTGPISVSVSETIKAIAIDSGSTNSSIATATYVINAAAPTIDFSLGFASVTGLTLNGSVQNSNDSRLELTDGGTYEAGSVFWNQKVGVSAFSTQFLFQLSTALADGFTFTIQNNSPTELGGSSGALGYASIPNSVAVKFDLYDNNGEGTDSTGVYTNGASPTVPAVDMTASGVVLRSGDGMSANLTYDGTTLTLVLTDGTTNSTFTMSKAINIPATIGSNTAYVGFTAGTGGLSASQKIVSWTYNDLSGMSQTPTPTFTPAAGTYTGAQTVTIADTDTNAAIYYTVDGSTPAASSTHYTTPIAVNASETINAIAVDSGKINSVVATAAYVISQAVTPTPTFTPAAGTYSSAQNVTIADADTNAVIYYTIDGSTPTASSTHYTAPIAVSASETINAIAIETGKTNSAVATAAYVISLTAAQTPTPSFTPAAGTYTTAQSVAIADTDTSAAIYYTIDGSTPTASSTHYTAPIAVTASETIKAIAIETGKTNSAVAAAAYVILAPAGTNFALSGTPVTITAGATTGNTSTITVTPSGGFTGSVALTAALTSSPTGAIDPPTFSFGSTSSASITGTSPATATLTISTTGATTSALNTSPKPGVPWYVKGGAALACLLMFGIPSRRRAWRAMLAALLFLIVAGGGLTACTSSGSSHKTVPGTTAGAYTFTVTGTSGSITQTAVVNLTVQ